MIKKQFIFRVDFRVVNLSAPLYWESLFLIINKFLGERVSTQYSFESKVVSAFFWKPPNIFRLRMVAMKNNIDQANVAI